MAVDVVADPSETRGFIGEHFDAEAGLQYLNARYYDPEMGLFLQPDWLDPTDPGVGTNRYAYSFNDPVNLSDPAGNAVDLWLEAISLSAGYASFNQNIRDGNYTGAAVDAATVATDTILAAVPGIPGGASLAVAAIRQGGKTVGSAGRRADRATNRTGSAVDGIYGNTRPMTDEFPELAGVNPYYVDGAGPGVNTNCVSCVNATVDRLTGRNPNAVAGASNGYGRPNDLLPLAPFGFRSPTNPANVTNELVAQGDGAVAVVRIQQAGPVEHVIVGVNRGGTVHFIDPQLGSIVDLQPNLTVIPGYR